MQERITISAEALHIELKEMFESNITTYAKCSEVIRSKYKMGAERFTKQYNEAHSDWSQAKQVTQDKVIQAKDIERLESGILDKEEGLQILTSIARGETQIAEGNIIAPSPSDRRGAVLDIAKIEGWIAPLKVAETGVDGKEKPLIMTIEQLDELKRAIEK